MKGKLNLPYDRGREEKVTDVRNSDRNAVNPFSKGLFFSCQIKIPRNKNNRGSASPQITRNKTLPD